MTGEVPGHRYHFSWVISLSLTMADNKADTVVREEPVLPCTAVDETSPLLESQLPKPDYVTFTEPLHEEAWTPSPGFWWIETGKSEPASLPACLMTTIRSALGKCLPLRIRRHHHSFDICCDQL